MTTIHAKYVEKLKEIENNQNLTKQLIEDIKELYKEKEKYDDDVLKLLELDSLIFEKEQQIKKMENDTFTMYLLKIKPIISSYTDTSKAGIFMKTETLDKGDINNFVTQRINNSKGSLYNVYMNVIENKPLNIHKSESDYICSECSTPKIVSNTESYMICPECGVDELYFESGMQGLTYEQEVNTDTNVHFAYKRINHFRELLAQLQAKETSDIPKDIIDNLRYELKKERIVNVSEITQTKVKHYLKKLKYNKYYENANQILNILTGTPPPSISEELNEKLTTMFMEIQEPFERVCPKNRKNFLSYNYVLYKFCEILNETEIMNYFPLLKSREKLYQQDCIWKDICKIKNWDFFLSV